MGKKLPCLASYFTIPLRELFLLGRLEDTAAYLCGPISNEELW